MRKSLGLWPTTNFYVLESRVGSFKGLVQRRVEGAGGEVQCRDG